VNVQKERYGEVRSGREARDGKGVSVVMLPCPGVSFMAPLMQNKRGSEKQPRAMQEAHKKERRTANVRNATQRASAAAGTEKQPERTTNRDRSIALRCTDSLLLLLRCCVFRSLPLACLARPLPLRERWLSLSVRFESLNLAVVLVVGASCSGSLVPLVRPECDDCSEPPRRRCATGTSISSTTRSTMAASVVRGPRRCSPS